jgi:hypothetical protein
MVSNEDTFYIKVVRPNKTTTLYVKIKCSLNKPHINDTEIHFKLY